MPCKTEFLKKNGKTLFCERAIKEIADKNSASSDKPLKALAYHMLSSTH